MVLGERFASAHVVDEALPKRCHDATPRCEGIGRPFTVREDELASRSAYARMPTMSDGPERVQPIKQSQPTQPTAERFSSTLG